MGTTASELMLVAALLVISNLFILSSSEGQYSCQVDWNATYQYHNSSSNGNHSSLAPADSGRDQYQRQADAAPSSTASGSPPPPPSAHPTHPMPPPPVDHASKTLGTFMDAAFVATEFMMASATGENMDSYDATVAGNGPPPEGGRKANLDGPTEDLIKQMALQSVDQIKTVKDVLGSKARGRPAMYIGSSTFAELFNNATGKTLWPDFDCYKNSINSLLTCYWFNTMLSKLLVGATDKIEGPNKLLVGSLAAAKASHEAVIRTLLYQKLGDEVYPYKMSVADFTNKLSQYRDKIIGAQGVSDEGLWVPSCLGTGGNYGNILSLASTGLPYFCNETRVMECFKPFLLNYNGTTNTTGSY